MAHSRKRTPILSITCAASEKDDKRKANRAERRRVRVALGQSADADTLPHRREISDPWAMAKDGKRYWVGANSRDLRK